MQILQQLYDSCNETLLSENLILHDDSARLGARVVGQKDILNLLLNIEAEDLGETENEEA